MLHKEFGWKTADGLNIFAQYWQPERDIKGVICLVHGLGEHSSRYKVLPAVLAEAGYATVAYDQRGHGKSEGKRGHTPSFSALLEDITRLLKEAAILFPETDIFLYGHSMGGNLVLNYALRLKPELKGVIATGPWLRLSNPPAPYLISAARFLTHFWPSFTVPNGIKPSELSHDKSETAEEVIRDEYLHPWITAGTFIGVHDAGIYALEHAADFRYPLLIMHGAADHVTSAEGSREFTSRVSGSCTLKIWEDLYHEIHNEPHNEEIFTELLDWLDEQTDERNTNTQRSRSLPRR